MKKSLLVAGFCSVFFFLTASAQAVPDLGFSVLNISQENKDAQTVGAKEGDVLRYELLIDSKVEDVSNFIASADLSEVLVGGELIDTGLGVLEGNNLVFPAFSQTAPCQKVFTFFVRIKPCDAVDSLIAKAHGKTLKVDITCGLTKTGPSQNYLVLMILIIGISGFMFFHMRKKV